MNCIVTVKGREIAHYMDVDNVDVTEDRKAMRIWSKNGNTYNIPPVGAKVILEVPKGRHKHEGTGNSATDHN